MRTGFIITGLVILMVANILLLAYKPGDRWFSNEGFTNYFLENGAGTGASYQKIGAFDGVRLASGNDVSQWRATAPNEPLLGPEFEAGPDSLFIFKNNQCKPECCGSSFSCGGGCVCTTPKQRDLIASRGGNRTVPGGDI